MLLEEARRQVEDWKNGFDRNVEAMIQEVKAGRGERAEVRVEREKLRVEAENEMEGLRKDRVAVEIERQRV